MLATSQVDRFSFFPSYLLPSSAGTELVGLAATETPNPRKSLPAAVKGTFWRIGCIYILSLLIIGLCVPWDTPALADGNDGTARTSPFVILVNLADIKVLPRESFASGGDGSLLTSRIPQTS